MALKQFGFLWTGLGKVRLTASAVTVALGLFLPAISVAASNGFVVKFTAADGKSSDLMVLPNLWLYVEQGKPATPFLPPGKFAAVFEGSINGDLRSDYFFKAEELGGTLKLEINNSVVLDTTTPGAISGKVQINKGANAVRATFTSAASGDSFLRVGWTEKSTNVNPIPNGVITHVSTPDLQKAETVYLGRELFLEHRCAKCHTEKFTSPVPELGMDAPTFDGIGARRNYEWMAEWILDPKSTRASVHMPKLLHGPKAKEDAEAIAAYLATLQVQPAPLRVKAAQPFGFNAKANEEISRRSGVNAKTAGDVSETPADSNQERKPIFERLHCIGCHNTPGAKEIDPAKISLKHVAQKFSERQLVEFLKWPDHHFAWIRMPDFKLAEPEAKEITDLLWKDADKAGAKPAPIDKAIVERGQNLVQTTGCLNCHVLKLENQFKCLPLDRLTLLSSNMLRRVLRRDCLDGPEPAADYSFSRREHDALAAFTAYFASLSRHSPLEFAERETRLLNCTACHGQIDLIPTFDVLGGKLKPEWAAAFIAGEPFKMRADKHPKGELWVEARMPAFRSRAALLAEAMAMQQGYPPKTRDEGATDTEAAKIGHKMIGMDGGLSCVNCHAVNDLPAVAVFESEGINLGLASARLLKPYFFRWLRSPLAVEPGTKMPAYFEDGRSALTDFYEGDAEKQINALYQYIRAGEQMAVPATGQ